MKMSQTMQEVLISIIVPVYNVENYLERCVDSLLNQTYRNLEILLVDDGSTDRSGELCDSFAKRDTRVQVIHKPNGGSSSARNVGISRAKGEYIGFVDSDDYVDPDMYERLYQGIQMENCLAAQIGRDEITPDGEILPDICIPPKEPILVPAEDFLKELLMHRGDCSFCTKLIHRSVFDSCKPEWFPEGVLNEDFHLLVRMLPGIRGIVSLPGHAYHVFYRIGSNSRIEDKNAFSRVFYDCVVNADWVEKEIIKQYPKLEKTALRFNVFQRIEYLLHIPISQMTRENPEYKEVVKGLRKRFFIGLANPYLTLKNKLYMLLFAVAPGIVRKVHRKLKRL